MSITDGTFKVTDRLGDVFQERWLLGKKSVLERRREVRRAPEVQGQGVNVVNLV